MVVYRFRIKDNICIVAEDSPCKIRVESHNFMGERWLYEVDVGTIIEYEISVRIIFGVWLNIFGFGFIALLTVSYHKKDRKGAKYRKTSEGVEEEEKEIDLVSALRINDEQSDISLSKTGVHFQGVGMN